MDHRKTEVQVEVWEEWGGRPVIRIMCISFYYVCMHGSGGIVNICKGIDSWVVLIRVCGMGWGGLLGGSLQLHQWWLKPEQ